MIWKFLELSNKSILKGFQLHNISKLTRRRSLQYLLKTELLKSSVEGNRLRFLRCELRFRKIF